MQYFIIFGKTILVILSPHSINSDIHFVQGLLSLGCQKNIKAGSTRGKYFQMALTARWPPPPLHTPIHTARQGERSQWPPIRGLKTPLQSDKKQTFGGGKVETEAISIGTQAAVLRCGQASDS